MTYYIQEVGKSGPKDARRFKLYRLQKKESPVPFFLATLDKNDSPVRPHEHAIIGVPEPCAMQHDVAVPACRDRLLRALLTRNGTYKRGAGECLAVGGADEEPFLTNDVCGATLSHDKNTVQVARRREPEVDRLPLVA